MGLIKWYQRSTGVQLVETMRQHEHIEAGHAAGQCQEVYNTVYQGSCNTTCPCDVQQMTGPTCVVSPAWVSPVKSESRYQPRQNTTRCYLIALLIGPDGSSREYEYCKSGCCLIILKQQLYSQNPIKLVTLLPFGNPSNSNAKQINTNNLKSY